MPIPSKPLTRLAAMATLALLASAPVAHASTNVGVSVSVNQPGFYGRVDIGDQPPVLLYPQPVIIQQTPYGARQRPIYMYVPPGHSKNWSRYCGQYGACGQPVYFLRERPPARYDDDRHDRHDHDRGDWRDNDRRGDDDQGRGRGHDRGRGHGRGHDRD